MIVEYRIANRNNDEYFAQMRYKKFLFWSKWKKIAKHNSGYGMYGLPDWNYPKPKVDCENMVDEFHIWFQKQNTTTVKYFNL